MSLVSALSFAGIVAGYAYGRHLNWSLFQYAIAVILVFDIVGGIATNATSTAKRWYHRAERGLPQRLGSRSCM